MLRTLALLAIALSAHAGPSMQTYLTQMSQLTSAHRSRVARLSGPANATAGALLSGGRFFLSSIDNRAWFYEGLGRAGGIMQTLEFTSQTSVRAGDVVWISYTAANYPNAVDVNASLTKQNVVVVAFGPQPPAGRPPFANWVDSLTPWNADDNFALMGNVLSLWSMEGELASATARQGKSLVYWQSILAPSGPNRNALYTGPLFHDGFPAMEVVEEGAMSSAYLDNACALFDQITLSELPHIDAAAQVIAQRRAAGERTPLVVTSHLLPFLDLENSPFFEYIADPARVDAALAQNGFLVNFGYSGVDLDLWRKVRLAAANAVWITGELPNQTDFSGRSDISIDQHWKFGDASVVAAGYDVRLLPLSGIAQLFIYELLTRATSEPQQAFSGVGRFRNVFHCGG